MKPIVVMGIDPSFSSTGIAIEGQSWTLTQRPMTVSSAVAHADVIADFVASRLVDLAVIEAPVARGPSAHVQISLAGLGWIIRARIFRDCYVVDVNANDRMLWATGKGQCSKPEVAEYAVRHLGLIPIGKDSDFDHADALVLAEIGEVAYGLKPFIPALHHRVVLGRLNWPRIGGVKPDWPTVDPPRKKKS